MNLFEFFGVFLLGSVFNVMILALAVGIFSKQIGGQIKQIITIGRDAVLKIKGGASDGE